MTSDTGGCILWPELSQEVGGGGGRKFLSTSLSLSAWTRPHWAGPALLSLLHFTRPAGSPAGLLQRGTPTVHLENRRSLGVCAEDRLAASFTGDAIGSQLSGRPTTKAQRTLLCSLSAASGTHEQCLLPGPGDPSRNQAEEGHGGGQQEGWVSVTPRDPGPQWWLLGAARSARKPAASVQRRRTARS